MRLILIVILSISLSVIPGCASVPGPHDAKLNAALQSVVRETVQRAASDHDYLIVGQMLRAPEQVDRFYAQRNYLPLWFHNQAPRKQLATLQRVIAQVDEHGLSPNYFHYDTIKRAFASEPRVIETAELDILLTDAYISYAAHMMGTVLNPAIQQSYWQRERPSDHDLLALLGSGFKKRRFEKFLANLAPDDETYRQLQNNLAQYRDLAAAGGWPIIPTGGRLELGMESDRIPVLRDRLFTSGDLDTNNGLTLFDGELEQALKRFQNRHGLEADGIVGHQTLTALNRPVEWRINQIALNMERRRWLPRSMPSRLVRVNIPDYRLEAFDNGKPVLEMNVVVGQKHKDWKTPQINSAITHMVLNPLWNVPPGIFAKEMLQEIQENPDYLTEQNMIVVRTRGAKTAVDPETIDWSQVDPDHPDIRIIQKSGRGNALGQVKFIFPNPHAIYLHDTTAKTLFARSNRAFSHGCVRVEKPMELAAYLLSETPDWPHERFRSSLASTSDLRISLKAPVVVQILYWTAWPDENGEIQFRTDVYGYDRELAQALDLLHPQAAVL